MMVKSQKNYWEKHIINWEKSAYKGKSSGSIVERTATLFRGHLIHRKNTCKRILVDRIEGKRILELGCGTGTLLRELAHEGSPCCAVGWEISGKAVEFGRQAIIQEGLQNICRMECRDIKDSLKELNSFDIIYGLGILEYLHQEALFSLFENLTSHEFFFQYHRNFFSMKNILHRLYRAVKRVPVYNQYTKREILALSTRDNILPVEIKFLEEKGNSFIYQVKE